MSKAIMEGSAEITDAQLADIQAGKTYVNIHTAKFPDGEIRGQLAAAK
jgi:CHRD domain